MKDEHSLPAICSMEGCQQGPHTIGVPLLQFVTAQEVRQLGCKLTLTSKFGLHRPPRYSLLPQLPDHAVEPSQIKHANAAHHLLL